MQINRLFEMIYILIEKRKISAKDLAARFEVSTRTVYRDIEILSGAGIPVYTTCGRGGGISILDNFILNKSVITEKEQEQILLALRNISVSNEINTDEIFSKLSSLFNKNCNDWIEIDFNYWSNNKDFEEKFLILKQSILENKTVTFIYNSAKKEKTERIVEPLKLIFKSQNWYLYGYCKTRNDKRFFKLTRIDRLNKTNISFQPYNIGKVCVDGYNEEKSNLVDIILKFDSQVAFRVYDEFENIIENSDGTLTVNAQMPENEWLYSYFLSFENHITVVSPENIRNKMKSIISLIKNNYI